MKPLRGKPRVSEKSIQDAIRVALRRSSWTVVEKTHGNAFQAGWPDLYCFRPASIGPTSMLQLQLISEGRLSCLPHTERHCWIEVKTPNGKLTNAQKVRFAAWEANGLDVWVLDSPDLSRLEQPANWREWL